MVQGLVMATHRRVEKEEEGGNGGGEVATTPLDDLIIQWTTSMSGTSDWRDAGASSSSEEAVEEPPSGPKGGERVVGERVAATPPVEPNAQPVTTDEGRGVVVPPEETVIIEEVVDSEDERERVSREEEREGPRGDDDTVMAERGSGEVLGTNGGGDVGGEDPKGKKVMLEPVREQGPVGISLGDYAVHANAEDVAAIGREALGLLDSVREEVVERRQTEIAVVRQAILEAEAEMEEWIREAEEEELELRAWEEFEVAQGPRVSVVQEAIAVLEERPCFDEATYDPPVHLFIPSGIDAYVS